VSFKASFADAHRCAALTGPARFRVVGNYRSDGEIQRTICAKPAALSHCISAITVLCLDESLLEPSRSFHDVLLPRLVLACTADGARVR
jgi:hypothetical protein